MTPRHQLSDVVDMLEGRNASKEAHELKKCACVNSMKFSKANINVL